MINNKKYIKSQPNLIHCDIDILPEIINFQIIDYWLKD